MPRVAFPLVLQSPSTGAAIPGATATINHHVVGSSLGSGPAATIYTAETGGGAAPSNQITADNYGRWTQGGPSYLQYWLAEDTYDIGISAPGLTGFTITRELASGNHFLNGAADYSEGTLASRPAVTGLPTGTRYRAIDTGQLFVISAGAWVELPASFNGRTGLIAPGNADYLAVSSGGLTGATAATRFVGGTTSGAPASGTFAKGDFVIDQSGAIWICTAAGTPGTWNSSLATVVSVFGRAGAVVAGNADYLAVSSGGLTGATAATRFVGGTTGGPPTSGTFVVGDFVIDQKGWVWICASAGTPGTWVRSRPGRVVTNVTQSATPAINTDTTDVASITNLAQAITSLSTNLTGTPVDGQMLIARFTDNGTARAINYGAKFESSTIALPTSTVASVMLTVGFEWNTVTSAWRCIAVA